MTAGPGNRPGTQDLPESGNLLLGGLLDAALGLLEGRRGSVMLLDEQKRLRIEEFRGLPAAPDPEQDFRDGPAGEVMRTGEPLHLQGRINGRRGIEESLILPLKAARKTLGTLNLSREDGPAWTEHTRSHAIRFAASMGEVLEVMRTGRDRDRRMVELDRVLAFSRIFGSTRELSKILELLISCARELTGCSRSFVTLYTSSGEQFEAWAGHNVSSEVLGRLIEGLRESFGHEFFAYAKPQHHPRLEDIEETHPLRLLWTDGLAGSAVVVPLVFGYRILGRLYLLDAEDRRMHRETLRLLMLLAHEASIAVDQARAIKELQDLAFVDPLTKVFNRNYWIQRFEEELVRSERRGQPLSLLMVDIDHFKAYNDTYGHLVGDEVLRMVAQVVRSCLREVDALGRFGGEEFGVLLPDTDEAGANYVAERIRMMVEQLDLGQPGSPIGGLTISIGVSCAAGRRYSVEELIRQSDMALFVSKEQGRNRVCIYTPDGVLPSAPGLPAILPEEEHLERLGSSSEFLFQMADSLGGAREQRPIQAQLGYQVLVLGGTEGEHLPLSHLFDSLGYRTQVNPADSELDPLSGSIPDLAILDLDKPRGDRDGLSRLRKLKTADPMLPVIVLTRQDGIEKAVEAIRLGADDYLLKPFGAKEIRSCVEKAFSKRFRLLRGGKARPSSIDAELSRVSAEVRREFLAGANELRILQAFNKRSIEHPTKGALMLNNSFRVVQINRLAVEMLGIREDGATGRSLFTLAPTLDNPRITNALTHVQQSGETVTINDLWLRAEGSDASALYKLVLQPLSLGSGENMLLILLENLLNQQRLEEEGRKLRMRLAQEIHGRIAQDLQVISGRADLLRLRCDSATESELDTIQKAARRISIMLGDLGADLPGSLEK